MGIDVKNGSQSGCSRASGQRFEFLRCTNLSLITRLTQRNSLHERSQSLWKSRDHQARQAFDCLRAIDFARVRISDLVVGCPQEENCHSSCRWSPGLLPERARGCDCGPVNTIAARSLRGQRSDAALRHTSSGWGTSAALGQRGRWHAPIRECGPQINSPLSLTLKRSRDQMNCRATSETRFARQGPYPWAAAGSRLVSLR